MEKKYESDMTPQEKRQAEIEKLKAMNFTEKLQYIWAYYKHVFVIILAVILMISLIVNMVNGMLKKPLISLAIVDVSYESAAGAEQLRDDLLEYMGTGNRREVVEMDSSVMSGDDYQAEAKRMTVIASGTLDILICDAATYEEYAVQDTFRNWNDILGDAADEYAEYLEDGKFRLDKSEKWKEYGLVLYEPVYAAVLVSGEDDEAIQKFASFFV